MRLNRRARRGRGGRYRPQATRKHASIDDQEEHLGLIGAVAASRGADRRRLAADRLDADRAGSHRARNERLERLSRRARRSARDRGLAELQGDAQRRHAVGLGRPDAPPVLEAERVELELSAMAALRGDVVFSTGRLVRPILDVERSESSVYAADAAGRRAHRARRRGGARGGRSRPGQARTSALCRPIRSAPSNSATADRRRGRRQGSPKSSPACRGAVDWTRAQPRRQALGDRHLARRKLLDRRFLAQAAGPVCRRRGAASASHVKANPAIGQLRRHRQLCGELLLRRPADLHLAVAQADARMVAAPICRQGRDRLGRACPAISPAMPQRAQIRQYRARRSTAIRAAACSTSRSARHVPGIAGTLAFETLDLRSFLAAFTPLTPDAAEPARSTPPSPTSCNLDLRLSAAKATAGDRSADRRRRDGAGQGGLAAFDISDATAFGGTVQAGLRSTARATAATWRRCGCWRATSTAASSAPRPE